MRSSWRWAWEPPPRTGSPARLVLPEAPALPHTIARDDDGRATVRAVRLSAPMTVDGRLDDEIYTRVLPASNFIQMEPRAGELATEKTEVWVFFEERNVYAWRQTTCRLRHASATSASTQASTVAIGHTRGHAVPVTLFDRKFGVTFIQHVPPAPGVYEMLDASGSTLYVGKAKNLKRRLAQYRGARQKKAHQKMRRILRDAATVRLRPCATELEALLLEHQLIHSLRPRLNLAGAYSFLYPCVGVRLHGRDLDLCCTTTPAELPTFHFYGAYRDRRLVREAFAAVADLLTFVAHREPAVRLADLPRVPFTRVVRFRQLDHGWIDVLIEFLRGDSRALLPQLVLALLDRPAARRRAQQTQARLDVLNQFFEQECQALRLALRALGRGNEAGVAQAARDPLFLEARVRSPQTRSL